jgi:hypothetical protein
LIVTGIGAGFMAPFAIWTATGFCKANVGTDNTHSSTGCTMSILAGFGALVTVAGTLFGIASLYAIQEKKKKSKDYRDSAV